MKKSAVLLTALAVVVVTMAVPSVAVGDDAQPSYSLPKPVIKKLKKHPRKHTPRRGHGTQFGGGAPVAGFSLPSKSCRRNSHGTRICRFFRNGQLVKVCTKKRGRHKSCSYYRAHRRALPAPARKAPRPSPSHSLQRYLDSGYSNYAAVGKIYRNIDGTGPWNGWAGWCSGTLIAQGIVLTAAHCLYDNDDSGTLFDFNPNGYYPTDQMSFIPGAGISSNGGIYAPYGEWYVYTTFVTQGYAGVVDQYGQVEYSGGYDWGLIVLRPDAYGRYPGQFTGAFSARANVYLEPGSRLFSIGYPASGGWSTPQYAYGGRQYSCDNTLDEIDDGGYQSANPVFRGTLWLVYESCAMNGGSSGGPVLTQDPADGKWVITAVNNRGGSNLKTDPYELWGWIALKSFFNTGIVEFYQGAVAQLRHLRSERPASSRYSPAANGEPLPTRFVSPGFSNSCSGSGSGFSPRC